jgi:uncharacterized protein with ParB-like and HNH nuclease domain
MVFNGDFNGNTFEVIDGQQRITTITILLCCIRDRFIEQGNLDLANAIHNKYLFSIDRDNNPYAILENKMPYPILQTRIQSKPEDRDNSIEPQKKGEKRILSSYNKLYKKIAGYSINDLKKLRDKVLQLETIFVAATGLEDASTIFMTLNATGKDLTALDLVKNYVFSKYPSQPHIDEPNDSWKTILQNTSGLTKDNEKDRFLNNSFASRYKKISDSKIYKEIVKQFKTGKIDAKKFISELKEDSEIYKTIITPDPSDYSKTDYDIYESINAIISVFKIEVANAFLLSLIREYNKKNISKKMTIFALYSIEHFHFINNAICSKRSSGYDMLYAKYAQKLFLQKSRQGKHEVIKDLVKDLIKRIPDKEDYNTSFDKRVYYISKSTKQKSLVLYILTKMERRENKNAILINISLEHIYPENPDKNWYKLNDDDNLMRIGNLTLLDGELNSEIGNKSYSSKRKSILEKSKIITTKKVFENEQWTEQDIIDRTQKIRQYMYSDAWRT